ncbi:MAG TPA: HAMP domain-containing sensor histidine kinase [Gemmatimonadaceae bacterium]|nr:HAMP domain-containing sensor histidine kinase [Gemmatimonadaceae bacterium]
MSENGASGGADAARGVARRRARTICWRMKSARTERWARRASSALLGLLVAAVLVVAGVLAYEAHDAAASHRATAERALRDYASVAAWELATALGEVFDASVAPALAAITSGKAASPFEPAADPATIAREAGANASCSDGTRRTFVTVDLRNGDARAAGRPIDESSLAGIRDAIVADVRARFRQERGFVMLDPAGAAAVAYGVRIAEHGAPLAAYAVTMCPEQSGARLVRPALSRRPLLPRDVTGGIASDSLLAISVRDARGNELLAPTAASETGVTTGQAVADRVGEIRIAVAFRPGALARLRLGPPARSRLPILLALLGAATGLLFVAALQLRREQELTRMRSDFVAGVSHELRTPLAQILLFAETLRFGRVRSEEERLEAVEVIVQEGQRLMRLVENVLHFARASRDASTPAPRPVALAPLAAETVARFAPLADVAGSRVELSCDESAWALAEAGAVRQILLNLLDNAIKHGPPGQRIHVGVERDGRTARLTVEDEGPGVPHDDRARVWLPFERGEGADARAGDAPGSGLGLAVVRELAAAFGGRAEVESGLRGGARFVVTLPAVEAPARVDRATRTVA